MESTSSLRVSSQYCTSAFWWDDIIEMGDEKQILVESWEIMN